MNTLTILGLVAGLLTTTAFLPQVIKTWKTRSTGDLSLMMFLIFFTGVTMWFVYGLMIGDYPLIIANAVTMLLSGIILFFKIIEK